MRDLVPAEAGFQLMTLDRQFPDDIPSLATREGQEWLEPMLDGLDVLFLDSVTSLAPFATNDEDLWLPYSAWLNRLRSKGLCIIRLMQAGRSGGQRGHSRSEDLLDVQIKLEADDADPDATDHCKCKLTWPKFRGKRQGGAVRALEIECMDGQWKWKPLEEEILKALAEYMAENPKHGCRRISENNPDWGAPRTIARLMQKLRKNKAK
jgi:putative DNA primase/helicase